MDGARVGGAAILRGSAGGDASTASYSERVKPMSCTPSASVGPVSPWRRDQSCITTVRLMWIGIWPSCSALKSPFHSLRLRREAIEVHIRRAGEQICRGDTFVHQGKVDRRAAIRAGSAFLGPSY